MLEVAISSGFGGLIGEDAHHSVRARTAFHGEQARQRRLRGLEQMQFGSSPRVCKLGYVLLFTVFGTLASFGQYGQYSQALGTFQGSKRAIRAIQRASRRRTKTTKAIIRYGIRRPINNSRR
jgi:hypothetical protein